MTFKELEIGDTLKCVRMGYLYDFQLSHEYVITDIHEDYDIITLTDREGNSTNIDEVLYLNFFEFIRKKEKHIGFMRNKEPEIKMTKDEQSFKDITDNLFNTFSSKNKDYGNSFEDELNEDGLIISKIHLSEKLNRFKTLINNKANVNESIEDTLMDMANYCIMTLMWLNKNKDE